ncbi:MAG: ankyrin repeat domain-containing protein [Wolbachia endosymbiont of Tyrophagus putrescentiae]|nr:ankyrin repeat domain-containing protein [Wolbachia endosymbiont of Tyrophagus putrescentiae]
MNDEQWKTILSTITDPNKSNIIEKIQEALNEKDEGEYKKWQEAEFDVNHLFEVAFANGSKSKCTLLHLAAVYGHTETVNALIDKDAKVNVVVYGYGYTPLHLAVIHGHTKTVDALIDKDAEVNVEDIYGYTPLHLAAKYGETDTVKALLKHKENVDVKDMLRYTPLHLAAVYGHIKAVEVLLENGAEVDAKGTLGYTPLHLAARNGHTETVDTLIDKGASVNTVDRWQQTPLHLAACSGHIETVKALLARGANPILKNNNRKTASDLALQNGREDIAKLLEKAEERRALKKGLIYGGTIAAVGAVATLELFAARIVELTSILPAVVIIVKASLIVGYITYGASKPRTRVNEVQEIQVIDSELYNL